MKVKEKISLSLVCLSLTTTFACAESMEELATQKKLNTLFSTVENTLKNNSETKAIMQNNKAYKKYIDEAKSGYYPSVDLSISLESKTTNSEYLDNPEEEVEQDGYNASLSIEQLLYDGGLTPARIEEAKFQEKANLLSNEYTVDNVIYDGVEAYLNLLKYDLRIKATEEYILKNEKYLEMAKENEQLTNNALDTHEVKVKLHEAKVNLIEEKEAYETQMNNYLYITGKRAYGNFCYPKLDFTSIPNTLEELLSLAMKENKSILEKTVAIRQQYAVIDQEKANYLPELSLNLSGTYDDELLTADTKQEIYSASVELNYNLFNGGGDSAAKEREVLFLKEAQSTLQSERENITNIVSSLFVSLNYSKEKITELEGYLLSSQEVLDIYKYQFEGGTKTFIDVLDMELDLYNAKLTMVNAQIDLAQQYYEILLETSKIRNNIKNDGVQACAEDLFKKYIASKELKNDDELILEDLLDNSESSEDLNTNEQAEEVLTLKTDSIEVKDNSSIETSIKSVFADEIAAKEILYNEKDNRININKDIAILQLRQNGIVVQDEYKTYLKNFMDKLLLSTKDKEYEYINLVGYSSRYRKDVNSEEERYEKNMDTSIHRAKKVYETIADMGYDMSKIHYEGKSHEDPILKSNGAYDHQKSKRVEFLVVTK